MYTAGVKNMLLYGRPQEPPCHMSKWIVIRVHAVIFGQGLHSGTPDRMTPGPSILRVSMLHMAKMMMLMSRL
jgi:hypothetical protein